MKRLLFLMLCCLSAPAWASDGHKISPMGDRVVAVTPTLISAANTNRASLSCTNNSTSVSVRWGNAQVAPTTGQRIPPAGAVEIRNTDAIYMAAESSTVTVSCTEEYSQ